MTAISVPAVVECGWFEKLSIDHIVTVRRRDIFAGVGVEV